MTPTHHQPMRGADPVNPIRESWESDDGRIRLLLGDWSELSPMFADNEFDACVADPPYGIGEAAGKNKSRGLLAVSRDYGNDDWDDEPWTAEQISEVRRVAKWSMIFGGNYYDLPPTSYFGSMEAKAFACR